MEKMKKGEMLGKMIVLATNAHAGQFDKGGQPYILHPLAVMQLTKSTDEEIQCIAVGHDIVEDCDVTWEDLLKAGFSDRIVSGIVALTKMPGETLEDYKRKVFANKDAMVVKKADLKHNSDITRLKGVRDKDITRMGKYMLFYTQIEAKLAEMGD